MQKDSISVIVPAYNEEKNIGSVIKDLNKLRKIYNIQIIVIDDASVDNTSQIAKKSGADIVVSHKKNKGKGAGFKTGLKHATGDLILQFDADGQLKTKDIPTLINSLNEGADMVLGARYSFNSFFGHQSTSWTNMLGNLFVSFVATVFTGKLIIDVMTGLKAFKKKAVKNIIPKANDFAYEAELVVRAAQKNYNIKTVQITCRERRSGKSNLSPFKHGISVIKTIIQTATS